MEEHRGRAQSMEHRAWSTEHGEQRMQEHRAWRIGHGGEGKEQKRYLAPIVNDVVFEERQLGREVADGAPGSFV
jgi:hypothetical protein